MAKAYTSAKVGGCEKCCYQFNVILLQSINFIDFAMGVILIAFFAYLYQQLGVMNTNSEAIWLEYSCGGLGILFVIQSFLGCCSIVSEGCRCGMVLARWLSYLLALLCLILGSAAFGKQKDFFNFLDSQLDGKVSTQGISAIKQWFFFIAISLFILFFLHCLQIYFSFKFREQSRRIDGEFGNLMKEEENAYKERLNENQQNRTEKYNDLRSYYKNKYSNKNTNEGNKDIEANRF